VVGKVHVWFVSDVLVLVHEPQLTAPLMLAFVE
jgi:hypothetical protein